MARAATMNRSSLVALAPFIGVVFILLVIPALYLVAMSVYRGGFSLAGYSDLASDIQFRQCLVRTFTYAASTVSLQLLIGVGCALLVRQQGPNSTFAALLLFLPYVVPSVVAVVMWRFAIEEKGLLSNMLNLYLGVPAEALMGDWILASLVLISVWQFYPFVFVAVLARLRQIPDELYLSGDLDGAGAWSKFWHITLPELRTTLSAIVVLRLIFMATKFDTPWLLAGRTANRGASTFAIYVYENGFMTGGRATTGAAAVVLGAMFVATLMWFVMLLRKDESDI